MFDQKISPMLVHAAADPFDSLDHPEKGTALFKEACRHQLEGIVAKGADSPFNLTISSAV